MREVVGKSKREKERKRNGDRGTRPGSRHRERGRNREREDAFFKPPTAKASPRKVFSAALVVF